MEESVHHILLLLILLLLLNYLQEVCTPYWPESGTFTYGDMTVTTVNVVEAKEYTTRVFKVNDKV